MFDVRTPCFILLPVIVTFTGLILLLSSGRQYGLDNPIQAVAW